MVTVYHAVRFERFGQMGGLERNSGVARGLRELCTYRMVISI